MPLVLLLPNYLIWHYSKGLKELLINWGNVLYFIVHYFSIPNLLLTLLSPWRRMDEGARRTINPGAIMEHVIFNTLMRAVGFLIRLVMIALGLIATACVILGGIILLLLWIVMPVFLALLIFTGITFLIKPTV